MIGRTASVARSNYFGALLATTSYLASEESPLDGLARSRPITAGNIEAARLWLHPA